MIPLKDDIRGERFPLATILLVVANIAVFGWQLSGPSFHHSVRTLGLIPATLWTSQGPQAFGVASLSLFTSMFAHGSLIHIGSNLLFLGIFGNNVEDAMGKGRFLVFYVLCGLGAAFAQIAAAPFSSIPMVGASGAISGVLGAYFLLYPRARVLAAVPIFLFIRLMWIPAVVFIGIWMAFQLLGGLATNPAQGGVAFWAHVGGFVSGLILVRFFTRAFRRRASRRRTFEDVWGGH